MEDQPDLHSRGKFLPLLERLLQLYDTLSDQAGLSRATQAILLGVSRQTHANFRRRPGGLDAATFLRIYEVNGLLRQALASGDLPVRHKPKRHAQPDVLRWFGLDPVEVERAQALNSRKKGATSPDEQDGPPPDEQDGPSPDEQEGPARGDEE